MRPPDKGRSNWASGMSGSLIVGLRRGWLVVAMVCFCGFVKQDQSSEQVGSDPSSSIDQVASEDDQMSVGAFYDLVLWIIDSQLLDTRGVVSLMMRPS